MTIQQDLKNAVTALRYIKITHTEEKELVDEVANTLVDMGSELLGVIKVLEEVRNPLRELRRRASVGRSSELPPATRAAILGAARRVGEAATTSGAAEAYAYGAGYAESRAGAPVCAEGREKTASVFRTAAERGKELLEGAGASEEDIEALAELYATIQPMAEAAAATVGDTSPYAVSDAVPGIVCAMPSGDFDERRLYDILVEKLTGVGAPYLSEDLSRHVQKLIEARRAFFNLQPATQPADVVSAADPGNVPVNESNEHLMLYNPYNGNTLPGEITVSKWQATEPKSVKSAWLFDPYTGKPRSSRAVGRDPFYREDPSSLR